MSLESCKECGNEVSNKAKFCTYCGVSKPTKTTHRFRNFLIIIGILFVFAATSDKSKNKTNVAKLTKVAKSDNVNKTNKPRKSSMLYKLVYGDSDKNINQSIEKEYYLDQTCQEISNIFGASSPHSDLQQDELWKKYNKRMFKWSLEVVEVSSGIFGGYTVQCKCSNSTSFIQDIQLSYDDNAKAFVLGLKIGKIYKIKGKLKNHSTLMGLGGDGIL